MSKIAEFFSCQILPFTAVKMVMWEIDYKIWIFFSLRIDWVWCTTYTKIEVDPIQQYFENLVFIGQCNYGFRNAKNAIKLKIAKYVLKNVRNNIISKVPENPSRASAAILEKWLLTRTWKIQMQKLSYVYFPTIKILYIFPVNALLLTPSWKNGGRKRFNAYGVFSHQHGN